MSNVLALAVVDAAQAHDDMVNAQVETLAPRDEVAVANALDDLGFNTWRAGVAASTAEESYSTALEVGATLAEAEIAFVEGWAARSAPVPANKKLAEQWAIAKAWAQACLDKADARAKKPNRHGQRDAAEQKAYDAAQSAKRYAKGNLGLKAKRAPRAAKADGVSTASAAEKDMVSKSTLLTCRLRLAPRLRRLRTSQWRSPHISARLTMRAAKLSTTRLCRLC
jgi:hypothetical protein